MKPLVWMRAIRDAPDRPPAGQLTVLLMLALRMQPDGTGWVTNKRLAADAGVDDRTVRRATRWARDHGHLVRTRKGHRVNAETAVASEYRLTVPTQPDTGVPLASQADTAVLLGRQAKGTEEPPKGTEEPPKGTAGTVSEVFFQEVFNQEKTVADAPEGQTPNPNQAASSNGRARDRYTAAHVVRLMVQGYSDRDLRRMLTEHGLSETEITERLTEAVRRIHGGAT